MSDVKAIVVESDDECSKLKPLVVKKKKPLPVSDDEDVSEDITESEDDITESEGDDEDSEEDGASFTTTEILQNDPLYFVLSRIFMTQDEEQTNVATLLQQIVKKLDILIQKKS
jgi:hypothetical protein